MAALRTPRQIERASPAWVLTYADLATLLLVFFVFLFSASDLSEAKFQAATGSLRANLGLRPRRGSVIEMQPPSEVSRRAQREAQRWGAPGPQVKISAAVRGTRVVLGGSLPFARGSAAIDPEARETLRRMADELRGVPNIVEVHGHAERGEGADAGMSDDMALSLARAANVATFLIEGAGIRRERLRVLGAGAEEPAEVGAVSAAHRRAEVIVVREHARRADRGAVEER